jgi:NADH pyrophosphatase NudC (nudix superfamily)
MGESHFAQSLELGEDPNCPIIRALIAFYTANMDLSNLDKMIAARGNRIEKRKEDGTLFEEEFKKDGNTDATLEEEVKQQKQAMEERMRQRIPPCPQCGAPMELMPEQGMIACQSCGVGMRI